MLSNCLTSYLTYHTSECRLKPLKTIFICLIFLEIYPFPKTGSSIDFKRLAFFFCVGGLSKNKLKNRPLAQLITYLPVELIFETSQLGFKDLSFSTR